MANIMVIVLVEDNNNNNNNNNNNVYENSYVSESRMYVCSNPRSDRRNVLPR